MLDPDHVAWCDTHGHFVDRCAGCVADEAEEVRGNLVLAGCRVTAERDDALAELTRLHNIRREFGEPADLHAEIERLRTAAEDIAGRLSVAERPDQLVRAVDELLALRSGATQTQPSEPDTPGG